MPKIVTGVSLDDDVFEETKKLAKLDGRPVSNYINMILAKNIQRLGRDIAHVLVHSGGEQTQKVPRKERDVLLPIS